MAETPSSFPETAATPPDAETLGASPQISAPEEDGPSFAAPQPAPEAPVEPDSDVIASAPSPEPPSPPSAEAEPEPALEAAPEPAPPVPTPEPGPAAAAAPPEPEAVPAVIETPPVPEGVVSTISVPPLPEAEVGEGGEWDLLVGKVRAWLDEAHLQERWNALGGPLRSLGLLLAALVVLRLYGALLETLGDLPLVPRLLQLAGLIALIRFALTRLVRSSDRERILGSWRQRWDDFRGRS